MFAWRDYKEHEIHRAQTPKKNTKFFYPKISVSSDPPRQHLTSYTIFGCIFLNRKLDSMSNIPKKGGGEREKEIILKTHKLLFFLFLSFPCWYSWEFHGKRISTYSHFGILIYINGLKRYKQDLSLKILSIQLEKKNYTSFALSWKTPSQLDDPTIYIPRSFSSFSFLKMSWNIP